MEKKGYIEKLAYQRPNIEVYYMQVEKNMLEQISMEIEDEAATTSGD